MSHLAVMSPLLAHDSAYCVQMRSHREACQFYKERLASAQRSQFNRPDVFLQVEAFSTIHIDSAQRLIYLQVRLVAC